MEVSPAGVASGIALLVSVTGLLTSRLALRRSSYRTATDYALDADRMFLDNPTLRDYFYEGKPPPEEPAEERARVMAAAEFYLDVFEAIWDHRGEFSRTDRAAWREWVHDLFESSPAMQTVYLHDPDWYPSVTSILAWEPCDRRRQPGEDLEPHNWARSYPGPSGSGAGFRARRLLHNVPVLGRRVTPTGS